MFILQNRYNVGKIIKLTYDFVKSSLEKEGYVLLSESYTNAITPLSVVCPKDHNTFIKWREFKDGSRCKICSYLFRGLNQVGINNPSWKGGTEKNNLPLYETYAEQLEKYQVVNKVLKNDLELLGTACLYCGNIFVPSNVEVKSRLAVIKGKRVGESNFYCSENCKKACPTYGQKLYPKDFKQATSREVQPQLRKMVLKRDFYECQLCKKTIEEVELHCHHIEAVSQNPIESADLDNCITLCKKCHKKVHELPNCSYHELKCN